MNIKGSKHLTLRERIAISEFLIQNKSLFYFHRTVLPCITLITQGLIQS